VCNEERSRSSRSVRHEGAVPNYSLQRTGGLVLLAPRPLSGAFAARRSILMREGGNGRGV
jgi:hypothetical protein